jgi:hypothetical protein
MRNEWIHDEETEDSWDPIPCVQGGSDLAEIDFTIEDVFEGRDCEFKLVYRSPFLRLGLHGNAIFRSDGPTPRVDLIVCKQGPIQGTWKFRYLPERDQVQVQHHRPVKYEEEIGHHLAALRIIAVPAWRTTPELVIGDLFRRRLVRKIARFLTLPDAAGADAGSIAGRPDHEGQP